MLVSHGRSGTSLLVLKMGLVLHVLMDLLRVTMVWSELCPSSSTRQWFGLSCARGPPLHEILEELALCGKESDACMMPKGAVGRSRRRHPRRHPCRPQAAIPAAIPGRIVGTLRQRPV